MPWWGNRHSWSWWARREHRLIIHSLIWLWSSLILCRQLLSWRWEFASECETSVCFVTDNLFLLEHDELVFSFNWLAEDMDGARAWLRASLARSFHYGCSLAGVEWLGPRRFGFSPPWGCGTRLPRPVGFWSHWWNDRRVDSSKRLLHTSLFNLCFKFNLQKPS